MHKVGLSSCGFPLTRESFEALSKSGISAIEISLSLDKHDLIDHAELASMSKEYGIELWSYHLPFMPFDRINIAARNTDLRKNSIEYFGTLIAKASDIGIDKFVIHPSGEPIANDCRDEQMKYSMESLDELAEIACRYGSVIAVEDLPRTCLGRDSDDMEMLLSANDKLRVCFDTNHLLTENNLDFADRFKDKIITLHVSDYDFTDEKHWLPGEGLVDWVALYKKLCEIGYSGVWLYELGREIPKTISRPRALTFEDFYSNAVEIFSGRAPSKIK